MSPFKLEGFLKGIKFHSHVNSVNILRGNCPKFAKLAIFKPQQDCSYQGEALKVPAAF